MSDLTNHITLNLCDHLMHKSMDGVVPNWYAKDREMDVAALHPSGHFQEFEIKISRKDFLADFRMKKGKHLLYESLHNQKHKLRDENEFGYVPAQFYYVCPKGLDITPPKYAGLIWFEDDKFVIVKRAPKIHAGKPSEKLIKSFYRCMSWRLNTCMQEKLSC